jgi:hypothetical protein
LTEPEGLEYDNRTILYKPYIQGEDEYSKGDRTSYVGIYSLKNKGKYMFTVEVFDTKAHASAYLKSDGKGTVDGNVWIGRNDETLFIKMASFVPTAGDWIKNLKQSGYMELK